MRTCNADSARFWTGVWTVGLSIVLAAASLAETAHPASMPDIAGRWKSETKPLVLDIMRCDGKYCGQEVLPSGCGRTVLVLGREKPAGETWTLDGTLDPPGETRRHEAIVNVVADPAEGPMMYIQAYVDPPTIEHRNIPFAAEFKRIGPPTCRPAPVS